MPLREFPPGAYFPTARKVSKGARKGDTFDCVPLPEPPAPTRGDRLPPLDTPAGVTPSRAPDVCCRGQKAPSPAPTEGPQKPSPRGELRSRRCLRQMQAARNFRSRAVGGPLRKQARERQCGKAFQRWPNGVRTDEVA